MTKTTAPTKRAGLVALMAVLALVLSVSISGCSQAGAPAETSATDTATEQVEDSSKVTAPAEGDDIAGEPELPSAAEPKAAPADGTYTIEVDTDSSMFRSERCELVVADGAYTAKLTLPGEGFSRLYFGSAEEAASASDDLIYDYYLNEEGKYTFDIPVSALDEELTIAAFGQRRDTWYDHTITFHAPE